MDKFICNKFGLAEFFSVHDDIIDLAGGEKVLDVGCGACPIGIFLAEQYNCSVVGIELNKIAYDCGVSNIAYYNLESKVKVINENFEIFSKTYMNEAFDAIIANPPIDENVSVEMIRKYAENNYDVLDDESFSYLTNSWHSQDGKDLVDYIFDFSRKNLKKDGRIYIVFCTIDCKLAYVIEKGARYGFEAGKLIKGDICPESLGVKSVTDKISAYIVRFIRR